MFLHVVRLCVSLPVFLKDGYVVFFMIPYFLIG
jgi:hypothetical protein